MSVLENKIDMLTRVIKNLESEVKQLKKDLTESNNTPEMVSTAVARRIVGCSESTIRRYLRDQVFTTAVQNKKGRWRIDRRELVRYKESN